MRALTQKQKLAAIITASVLAVVLIVIVIVSVVGDDMAGKTPVSADYITVTVDLDSGASVSLRLDPDDYTVTAADTLDPDDYILSNNLGANIPYKQSADQLIKNLVSAGILSGGTDQTILFSVESLDESDFNTVCGIFKDALSANSLNTRVYTLYIKVKEDKIQEFADNNGVSYAKAYFCTKLAKEGADLKADELIGKSITEIIDTASSAEKNEDFVSSVVSDSNKEQANTSVPSTAVSSSDKESSDSDSTSSDSTSSDAASSDITSSDATSSDTTSSDTTSSDNTSSGTTSSGPNTYPVVPDDDGWLPGLY